MSRLGDPAPQARSGAARFASPQIAEEDAKTLKIQSVETPKPQKQPMTIRFTPETLDRLADLERHLRRTGFRAHQASASEIIGALIWATTPETVQELLRAEK